MLAYIPYMDPMGLIQLEGPPFWRRLQQRYFRRIKSEALDVVLTDLEQWSGCPVNKNGGLMGILPDYNGILMGYNGIYP